ncbi:hypothetical protein [Deinococcus aerophilus]|nr:hypothetical protein [Deinococcus aerophilus]
MMYAATLICVLAARRGGGNNMAWRWIALAVGTYVRRGRHLL